MNLTLLAFRLAPFFTQQLYSDEIEMHMFIGSKAPWDHIRGHTRQFTEHADVDEDEQTVMTQQAISSDRAA